MYDLMIVALVVTNTSGRQVELQFFPTSQVDYDLDTDMQVVDIVEQHYGDFAEFFERADEWCETHDDMDDYATYSEFSIMRRDEQGLPPVIFLALYDPEYLEMAVHIGLMPQENLASRAIEQKAS